MQNRILTAGAVVVLFAFGAVCLAQNQDGREKTAGAKKNPYMGSPLTWGVEPIIESYTSQMTRYYNLTPDQEEYTRQLLTQRVKRFLSEYEKDVRSLFTEYWHLQLRGEAPSVEEAKDLARRGGPLIAAIKKEIMDGNQKWREILDENQRKIHDRDLDQMNKTFDEFEQKLDRWSKGDVRSTDMGKRGVGDTPRTGRKFEDAWEFRVNSFIQDYNLDAGQQETARSILRELREEAARYRERNQERFTAIESRLKEIYNSDAKTDPEEKKKAAEAINKLNEEINALERPIREDLWKQLLARLERIPTDEQRRMRREKNERLMARLAGGRSPATQTSRPDTAQSHPAEASSVK